MCESQILILILFLKRATPSLVLPNRIVILFLTQDHEDIEFPKLKKKNIFLSYINHIYEYNCPISYSKYY